MKSYQIHKNFFKDANLLREQIDLNFKNPRSTESKRFVWDYWYFEDQYHLIRTPAIYYFQKKLYSNFHSNLVQWGRENLGCHDISPPWLSYYVDGCFQNLHSDVPHGPWAFVYSLTQNSKDFHGGETLILKPDVLNYWPGFQDQNDREYKSFVDRIPSGFNQLTVFDPRFPHGVTEVKGTRDPLKSRIVMHGWFVEPRPYIVGGLTTAQTQNALNPAFSELSEVLSQLDSLHGTLSLRVSVSVSGDVQSYRLVSNTVLSIYGNKSEEVFLQKNLKQIFSNIKFPRSKSASKITIPLLFK
jgi:hypothetical protein